MERLKQVNWSEVTRAAIVEKIRETELWQPVDTRKMKQASADIDELRRKISGWNNTVEIRKWRERDRQYW